MTARIFTVMGGPAIAAWLSGCWPPTPVLDSGSATGGSATTCPGDVPAVVSLVGVPMVFGDPGCAGSGAEKLRAAASIDGQNTLSIFVETESNSEFTEPGVLDLHEGSPPTSPTCSSQAVSLNDKPVQPNSMEQFITYPLDANDPTWAIMETRTFWVGETFQDGAPPRATGPVEVVKACCTPKVTSVSPDTGVLCGPTTFTVTGECLPSTLAFWFPQCPDILGPLNWSPTQAQFTCTPCTCAPLGCEDTGTRTILVKDRACTPGQSSMPTTLATPTVTITPAMATCACPPAPTKDPCQ